MIGFGFTEHGGLDRTGPVELPEPEVGPEEVRVRIRAAAFNHLDLFTLEGLQGVDVVRPHVLGSDGAGVVDRVGDGVGDLGPGERVLINPGLWCGVCEACRADEQSLCRTYRILGEHTQGSAAPFVVVPRRNLHSVPDGWSFRDAASVGLVFQTAWRALRTVGALQPGERCAIIGAGGGVSTAAVQIAKQVGARVAVVTRWAGKGDRSRALGADDVLVTSEEDPLDRALWKWSEKKGVDLILDSVGQATLPRSIRALGRLGRVVVIGGTAGTTVPIDLKPIFWRQASIRGSTMASEREFDDVLAQLRNGAMHPVVDSVFPLDQGRAALERLTSKELFGKVVLDVT